ncbi:interleukin-20 receptor subunit alpha-like [Spea bombifrons]|uniref:interleukin-20 receptor subunit alpha-like n=1 Tax=Spea bombifrons TaxID=233779 RepID=UPI00234ABB8A|nr:interleukin-20 receptor subunit alpha-like [Spea bombifrons]
MTSEMSSPEHQCEMNFARVKVTAGNYSSPWKNSGSFHPFHDSTIGPPTVTLSHSFNSITVNMSLPQTIVHSKCLTERNKKKIQFIITVSHLAEVPETYYTKEKVWNISNLSPGSTHCISVEIELWHKKKRSMASPTHCVNLEKKTAKEIIIGLLAAAVVIVMAFSIIIIYLTLYKFVLHPKAHLPSNLVLKGTDSHSNEREWEENGFVPLTFERTELIRYIHETKESNMESPQYKRYVSNEPRIKKYVNCRQKAENLHDVLQSKTVELVNPTYTTKMFKSCHIQEEHTDVYFAEQYICKQMGSLDQNIGTLHYLNIPNNQRYVDDNIVFDECCMDTIHLYINKDDSCHMNKDFQSHNNYFNQ